MICPPCSRIACSLSCRLVSFDRHAIPWAYLLALAFSPILSLPLSHLTVCFSRSSLSFHHLPTHPPSLFCPGLRKTSSFAKHAEPLLAGRVGLRIYIVHKCILENALGPAHDQSYRASRNPGTTSSRVAFWLTSLPSYWILAPSSRQVRITRRLQSSSQKLSLSCCDRQDRSSRSRLPW